MVEQSLSERIIIARPELVDPSFARTVVYLLEHDENGAVGVILNRVTDVPVSEHLPLLGARFPGAEFSEGGPVGTDSLIALSARLDEPAQIADIQLLLSDEPLPDHVRFFVGYAGWGEGQLEQELAQEAWLVARLPTYPGGHARDVFAREPTHLWRDILQRQPPPISQLALYPDDLSAN